MEAVLSGRYDTSRLAIMMTQTGGCCRASNYVAFIRRALDKVNLSHVPVISLNLNGMEKNPGFRLTPVMLFSAARALALGDLLMKCLYRTRPYEAEAGSADALHRRWEKRCIDYLTDKRGALSFGRLCRGIVSDFDALPLQNDRSKPRVGVVGEILVKYMPLANNHLVELLEREGAEAVVPDLLDFFQYSLYNGSYQHRYLGRSYLRRLVSDLGTAAVEWLRAPATRALKKSKRFAPPVPIGEIAELAKPFLSIGNQYGEGWFLTGEMIELIRGGTPNIVCIQPFACLPNHVVGKGVIKVIRQAYPEANICAVDYDPGASEVNQLNRIKLMLSVAEKRAKEEKASDTERIEAPSLV